MFFNLSKLTIKSTNGELRNLKPLISKFPTIKDIVLKIEIRSIGVKIFKFPDSSNLKEVEFNSSSFKRFEVVKWDASACPKLKLIKFVKNEADKELFDISKLNPELEDGWKPSKLIIRVYNKYYLLENITSVFTVLTSLVISSSRTKAKTFQYLLDNITYLESLSLSDTSLYDIPYSDSALVNWPTSLKKLKIYNNKSSYYNGNNTVLAVSNISGHFKYSKLSFSSRNLPNLKYLHYSTNIQTRGLEIIDFLALNPQIKHLKLTGNCFYTKLLATIKSVYRLSNLSLDFRVYSTIEAELKNISQLNNISCLTIAWECFGDINQIPTIKDIVLKVEIRSIGVKIFKFPESSNLKEVEFNFSSFKRFEVVKWDASACPKLKLIKFVKNEDDKEPFDMSKLNPELEDGWKVVYLPLKISYYRFNK
ncbi:hypothetical protein CONCODRAFT_13539 [Conidiobolus coronatus NRRL 28638]|uniref:RNI-like protein n=1 Tax=Conidiobolus coronatus (strain ATCC 28846 / CBS 209.66 / NRRL 28638) TaxID=796925 RepID=A0A137NQN7_CONC2|nr:hypothetical protein CONCODRAFT_13539 [Conidiobolus coronatus NRRL 28638]|eukprot:KXN65024.1 hypothetical protein CONCODRAFT_13539 [Conidiobolus coronatus NRRL 28638]